MTRKSQKWLSKYSKGLISASDDSQIHRLPYAYNAANAGYTQAYDMQIIGSQADPMVLSSVGRALNNPYSKLVLDIVASCKFKEIADNTWTCFVPFTVLSPFLDGLPHKAIYLGLGQAFKMNCRLLSPAECMYYASETNVANDQKTSYSISNAQLCVTYTQLDSPRVDAIQKSVVPLPLKTHVPYVLQTTTENVNAIYQVSKKQKIKGLWFSNPVNQRSTAVLAGTNVEANLVNETACQFKTQHGYFPQIPIKQIIILIGSQQIILNQQLLKAHHLIAYKDYDCFTHQDPILQQTRYAYYIPLQRFIEDALGSSGQEISQVTVQIQYDTTVKTLFKQPAAWASADIGRFQFYSFLETEELIQCKNGLYQYV